MIDKQRKKHFILQLLVYIDTICFFAEIDWLHNKSTLKNGYLRFVFLTELNWNRKVGQCIWNSQLDALLAKISFWLHTFVCVRANISWLFRKYCVRLGRQILGDVFLFTFCIWVFSMNAFENMWRNEGHFHCLQVHDF